MPNNQVRLDGSSQAHEVAPNYRIIAQGITGNAAVPSQEPRRGEAGAGVIKGLDLALITTESKLAQTFTLDLESSLPPPPGAMRGSSDFVLQTPDFGTNTAQAVLYTDQATGYSQWIFPEQSPNPATQRRGGASVTYRLPREPIVPLPPAPGEDARRGGVIKAIRKVVRVIAWKTDELIGNTLEAIISKWESVKRAYGWQNLPLNDTNPVDWARIQTGRSLLLIHGTFSSATGAFAALPNETIGRLQQIYNGRLCAFNHPSLSVSPQANIDELLKTMPNNLEIDVVTHSRGGLVGRELLSRVQQGIPLRVRKMIMVACPNRGTPLADGEHWLTMLDRYTSLLADLPDTSASVIMEGILTVVKLIGHAGLRKLPGLAAMTPKNSYLQQLNAGQPGQTQVYAMVADYQPNDPNWIKRFMRQQGNKLIDHFFGEANDGVVPTAGGYQGNSDGSGWSIPSERRILFDTDKRINHSSFFGNQAVNQQLVEWLR